MKIYNSITELVGYTPLVKLSKLAAKYKVKANILAKCEFYNPVFSVKDRVALKMLEAAEAAGKISENTVFIEATSGNTGIALASMCAAKGYNLVIVMPENMSAERIKLIRHFGAEVILTPAEDGMEGAVKKAELLLERNADAIMLSQFVNPANPDAHRFGTSIEIIEDTKGNVDAFVSAVGTAGTLSGTASTLRTYNPDLYVVAVEPAASQVLKGGEPHPHKIMGIGANFMPKFYDPKLVNEIMDVTDDEAVNMAKEAARIEGLPVGISSGAALTAAVSLGQRPEMKGKNIVVILASAVERYLSLGVFD